MSLFRFLRIIALLTAFTLPPWRAALGEIDLGRWNTYASMAEQGAVCGAFADIMAMQELVDIRLGRLWAERRNYSGSVIRRAAELEERSDVDDDAIDGLLARYSMWLLNNLTSDQDAEILDTEARDAARAMVADVCTTLYRQADRAIVAKHPTLAACSGTMTPLQLSPPALSSPSLSSLGLSSLGLSSSGTPAEQDMTDAQCGINGAILAAAAVKKAEQDAADMLTRLGEEEARRREAQSQSTALRSQIESLNAELDALHAGAAAARDTAARAAELNMSNERMRGRIAELTERAKSLKKLAGNASVLSARNEELLAEVRQLTARTEDSEAQLDVANSRIAALTDRLDRGNALPTETIDAGTNAPTANLAGNIMPNTKAPAPDRPALRTPGSNAPGIAAPADTSGTAGFVVQLGVFRSEGDARHEIAILKDRLTRQLADTLLLIETDRMADESRLFRIVTDSMPAASASALCRVLWNRRVGCMVRPSR